MDQKLAIYGGSAAATENFSGITRIGTNLRFYRATAKGGVFMGNQYVETLGISKMGKIARYGGAILGTGIDIYGVYKGTTPASQAGTKGFFSGYGLYGGPVGAGVSVVYSGINAFYPGGSLGFAEDVGQVLQNSGSPIMFQP